MNDVASTADDGETTFRSLGRDEIAVTRDVTAPARLVFAAWTDPRHLPHWLGRDGWTMTVCRSEPRPGGVRRFVWRRDDGVEMGVRGVYREVSEPFGFVCTETFEGAVGETVNTVHFVEHGTRTTITSTIRYPDEQARDAALRSRMRVGLGASLNHLDAHLRLVTNSEGSVDPETHHQRQGTN